MSIPRAATLVAAAYAASLSLALAQAPPPRPTPEDGRPPAPGAGAPPPSPPAEDEEVRRLREAAQAELAGAPAPGASPEEALRQLAAVEAEDESILYQQLLDAFSATANRLNAFNPRITVIGDVLGRVSASEAELVEDGQDLDDRVSLREVELDLRADVDPYAKAVLILAFAEEAPGEYAAEIEEGYVTFETLPLGLRAQVGRFRAPVGQMNRLHTHDLPQASRPYALQDLLGEEGLVENGAVLTWLAPWIPLELTASVMNGENEALYGGGGSDDPSYLGRAEYFVQLTQRAFVSVGATYLFGWRDGAGPTDPPDLPGAPQAESHIFGGDLLVKWQWNQFQSIALQAEAYGIRRDDTGGAGREHGFGAYGYLQVQPLQRWYLGARYDWSNIAGGVEDTRQWALGGWVSYYTTEFLRLRVGYEHRERQSTGGGEPDLDTVFLELTFVFGSHPVEPFWVNR